MSLTLHKEAQAREVFGSRTQAGSEHFARQEIGVSQNLKLIVSTSEKIFNNINVVVPRQVK